MDQPEFFLMRPGYEIGPRSGIAPDDLSKFLDGMIASLTSEIAKIDYRALPSVSIHCAGFAEQLPANTSAVYFLVHRDQGLLYVGKAKNIRLRWLFTGRQFFKREPCDVHHCLPRALELRDVRLHYWAIARQYISLVELILVRALKPIWNSHDLI